MVKDLKETLNLPETGFPMRGNLAQREPERISHWQKLGLYQEIQKQNAQGPDFILHDGPPFTNGDLHLGHALNKTLKDTILRFKWMQGYNAPYIPGWDSHGLPIEHKVSRELQDAGRTDYTPIEVREACAQFADKYRLLQTEQFQRLGVTADWANEYWTIHPEYEAAEFETFARFVEQGLVYRSKKPVYWYSSLVFFNYQFGKGTFPCLQLGNHYLGFVIFGLTGIAIYCLWIFFGGSDC